MSKFVTSIARQTLGHPQQSSIIDTIQKLSNGGKGFVGRFQIRPKEAEAILKVYSRSNRNISSDNIVKLVNNLKNGTFIHNGENIKIARQISDMGPQLKPQLIDGYHRLTACIQAKTPIDTDVCFFDPMIEEDVVNVMSTIDKGKVRTLTDTFNLNGIRNSSVVASAIRILLEYKETDRSYLCQHYYSKQRYFTESDVLTFYSRFKNAMDASGTLCRSSCKARHLFGCQMYTAIHYFYKNELGQDKVDNFIRQIGYASETEQAPTVKNYLLFTKSITPGWVMSDRRSRPIALQMAIDAFLEDEYVDFSPSSMNDFLESKGCKAIF